MATKIFLIGMPGSGKTTFGNSVAMALQLPFVDLDHEIETALNQRISEVFKEKGEDFFRREESRQLKAWAESGKSFVMATGGGAPCFYNGIEIMNASGTTVFLDETIDVLAPRMKRNKDRPLLAVETDSELLERLQKLQAQRIAIYSQAMFKLTQPTTEKILEVLRK